MSRERIRRVGLERRSVREEPLGRNQPGPRPEQTGRNQLGQRLGERTSEVYWHRAVGRAYSRSPHVPVSSPTLATAAAAESSGTPRHQEERGSDRDHRSGSAAPARTARHPLPRAVGPPGEAAGRQRANTPQREGKALRRHRRSPAGPSAARNGRPALFASAASALRAPPERYRNALVKQAAASPPISAAWPMATSPGIWESLDSRPRPGCERRQVDEELAHKAVERRKTHDRPEPTRKTGPRPGHAGEQGAERSISRVPAPCRTIPQTDPLNSAMIDHVEQFPRLPEDGQRRHPDATPSVPGQPRAMIRCLDAG